MTTALPDLNLTKEKLRYRIAGFFLAFCILFAGSHVLLSEICLVLFICFCLQKIKFHPILGFLGVICLIGLILSSLELDRGFNELLFILLLLLLPSFNLQKDQNFIDGVLKGITVVLSISATYGFFLLSLKVFLPSFSHIFEPCIYGMERNLGTCGIHPYIISGFPLHRLYGLASESSTFGITHVLLLSLLLSTKRITVSSRFVGIQIASILATVSITAIALLIVMFGLLAIRNKVLLGKHQRLFTGRNLKILLGVFLGLIILAVSVEGFTNVIFLRTFVRILELFSGEDTSAFMRSSATWGPVLDFFNNGSGTEIWFGIGVNEYLYFLENFSAITFANGKLVFFTGQRGSILSTLLICYGLIPVIVFILMMIKIDEYKFSAVFFTSLGFLFFHTSALSFSTIAIIYVIGINKKRLNNVK